MYVPSVHVVDEIRGDGARPGVLRILLHYVHGSRVFDISLIVYNTTRSLPNPVDPREVLDLLLHLTRGQESAQPRLHSCPFS
jgi:hypothetical protein